MPVPFVKGDPRINREGRPPGSLSIKALVKKHLEENPEDLKEYVKHFIKKNRELSWQMLEGRPNQSNDLNMSGDIIIKVSQEEADRINAINGETKGSNQESSEI